jgi:hypothetical protein
LHRRVPSFRRGLIDAIKARGKASATSHFAEIRPASFGLQRGPEIAAGIHRGAKFDHFSAPVRGDVRSLVAMQGRAEGTTFTMS